MTAQGHTGLHHLPQVIIDDILRTVQASCGFKGLANCRLVSKSWLAAVQLYPAEARDTTEVCRLQTLSQIFPNMASMAIACQAGAHLDLAALRKCSQLTSMSFSRREGYTAESTSMNKLPSNLREVKFWNLILSPGSLANTTGSLTQLHYQLDGHFLARHLTLPRSEATRLPRHLEWMQDFQHLQVLYSPLVPSSDMAV